MVRTGHGIRMRLGLMAAGMVLAAAGVEAQPRDPHPAEATPVFSADVVIDDQVIDEQGAVVETRPQTKYRMTVRRGARGLRTEIEYPPARLFPKGPLVDPRSGQRLVFERDLATGRIYDATGARLLGPPDDAPGPGAPETPQATGLVLADRDASARRRALVQSFGPARERLGGRDRYLATEGDLLTETLVDATTQLPVEVNVARDGALEQHTAIAYGRMPGGRWYVARMRSEQNLPGSTGRRFVSIRTHTNVESQEGR